jgi:TatD DNase family protein
MSYPLIDTHTHIYLDDFNDDRSVIINNCKINGINKLLLPNIDSKTIEAVNMLSAEYPETCYPMMGLHPCSVKKNYQSELAIIENQLNKENYIAIGEIGIDLYWDQSTLEEQKIAFKTQVKWAKEKKLPIVIHTRESFDEIFSIIDTLNDDNLTGVFHCFTGNKEQAEHIINYGGFKLGIGGVVTFKNAGLDITLKEVDIDHLVLETDSPYLTPVPFRGKRNESTYLTYVAEKLSSIYECSIDEIAKKTTTNAREVFKLEK